MKNGERYSFTIERGKKRTKSTGLIKCKFTASARIYDTFNIKLYSYIHNFERMSFILIYTIQHKTPLLIVQNHRRV